MSRRALQYAAFTAILVYFFAFTYRGLAAGISEDDVMNIESLHGWGVRPLWSLAAHAMLVATPVYRPMGGLVYRVLFVAFGLDPLPYRIFCFAVMILNLGLAARFVTVLTGSRVALFTALVFAFHTCMAQIYFESATLYDLLCFTFFAGALASYVSHRQRKSVVLGRPLVGIVLLHALALDSKEMAVTLPVMVMLYELIFQRGPQQIRARWIVPGLLTAISIAFSLVKTAIPNAISVNPLYRPRLDPWFILEQMRHYYSLLFWDASVSTAGMLIGLAALMAIAVVLRNRPMIFGWLFANIALLPVTVIPGRAGFVWYIPYLGWALYVGAGLEYLAQWLNKLAPKLMPEALTYVRAALFVLTGAALIAIQIGPSRTFSVSIEDEQKRVRQLLIAVKSARPVLPREARILLAEDTFAAGDWRLLSLFRLAYRDPSIWVDRPSLMGDAFDPSELSIYDAVVYTKQMPYRVIEPPKGIPSSPTFVRLSPENPHRGQVLNVEAKEFSDCPVDVEYRVLDGGQSQFGRAQNWCTLDGAGHCSIPIPADAEPSRVELRRIRFCHRQWRPIEGYFEIR